MKKIIVLLLVSILSGCIYTADSFDSIGLNELFAINNSIAEKVSILPGRDKVRFVYSLDNFDVTIPSVVNNVYFNTWQNVRTGEIVEIGRVFNDSTGVFESYIKTSKYYGVWWLTPNTFVVKGPTPEFDTIFTIHGFIDDKIVWSMMLQGRTYTSTWKKIIKSAL